MLDLSFTLTLIPLFSKLNLVIVHFSTLLSVINSWHRASFAFEPHIVYHQLSFTVHGSCLSDSGRSDPVFLYTHIVWDSLCRQSPALKLWLQVYHILFTQHSDRQEFFMQESACTRHRAIFKPNQCGLGSYIMCVNLF